MLHKIVSRLKMNELLETVKSCLPCQNAPPSRHCNCKGIGLGADIFHFILQRRRKNHPRPEVSYATKSIQQNFISTEIISYYF
jgi:hypothetical protein